MKQMNKTSADTIQPQLPMQFSLLGTLGWISVLALGVPLLLTGLIVVPLLIMGYEAEVAWSFYGKLEITLLLSVLTVIVSYPIVNAACHHANELGLARDFLAIKAIDSKNAVGAILLGLLLYALQYFVRLWLNMPLAEPKAELLNHIEFTKHLVLAAVILCFFIPIIEEVIFRGVAYRRIELSSLGSKGALVLTTLAFSGTYLYHSVGLMLVMLPAGLLLAIIRYKTANINYCILAHSAMNASFLYMAKF